MKSVGGIHALIAVLALFAPASASAGETLTFVTSRGDGSDANLADSICDTAQDGHDCTLRAAIEQTNATAGGDRVLFNIPGPGVRTITPDSPLPTITDRLIIDGFSQPGADPNSNPIGAGDNGVRLIELSGADVADQLDANGLDVGFGATDSAIKGLVINRFPGTGLVLRVAAVVQGNFIGTNPSGALDRGIGFDGIFYNTAAHTIGGPEPDQRNLISGNGRAGITGSGGATIQGNYIGTQANGRSPLGNDEHGISLFGGDNLVGGEGGSNVIAFNGRDGISLVNPFPPSTFSRNRIFANAGLGIDLGNDGVTGNDPGDADEGPNSFQNFPAVQSAVRRPDRTVVRGTLRSIPNEPFGIELFLDPAGEREGRRFLAVGQVTTDAAGEAPFRLELDIELPLDASVTATATVTTMDLGATSEFSRPRSVTSP